MLTNPHSFSAWKFDSSVVESYKTNYTCTGISIAFSNISAMSWRSVLVVEEAGVFGENHQPWASHWSTFSFAAASRVYLFL
jgi:hypothetical protein